MNSTSRQQFWQNQLAEIAGERRHLLVVATFLGCSVLPHRRIGEGGSEGEVYRMPVVGPGKGACAET